MNRHIDPLDPAFDPRIADWLESDSDRAPREVLETVLAAMPSIPQRRSPRLPWRLPEMLTPSRAAVAAIVGVLVIGGAFAIYQRPTPSGVGGVGTAPTATPSNPPSASPSQASPSASPSDGACGLVTADEVERQAGIVGLGALPTEFGTGNETTCIYSDGGGNVVLRLTYTRAGGEAAFDAVRVTPGVQPVGGLGDEAVFDPATSTLSVRKGDGLLAIFAGAFGQSTDRRQAIETMIAELAVDRMTSTQ